MLGTMSRVVYFTNRDGKVYLPPDNRTPTPAGMVRHECSTLGEIDDLQHRIERQEKDDLERAGQRDEMAWQAKRKEVRDSLNAKLSSSATSEYEKEFIRHYLQLSDDRKRENYRKRFECDLMARFVQRDDDEATMRERIERDKSGPQ